MLFNITVCGSLYLGKSCNYNGVRLRRSTRFQRKRPECAIAVVESGWHSIALFSGEIDDYYLERMFQLAADNARSLVVLEDSDGSF